MNLVKPKKLEKGDTIGILSVAGCIEDVKRLDNAKKYFIDQGYNVKISPNSYFPKNYLSGSDEARLEALSEFFLDSSVNAIVASRGGYGSLRLVNKINYDIIAQNPKIFAGYSDITILSMMFYKKTGLAGFNSPMAYPDFSVNVNEFSERSFFDVLSNNVKGLPIGADSVNFKQGAARGVLWGGNLASSVSLAGLDFIPDEKFIFFAEDVGEPVYKIDRMFTQLLNIEKFRKNLAGIILGEFTDVDSGDYFNFFFKNLEVSVPIKSGLKIGHTKQKLTVPIGVQCELDTSKNYIKILEDYIV